MFMRALTLVLNLVALGAAGSACVRLSDEPSEFSCSDGECPSGQKCVDRGPESLCIDANRCYVNSDCQSDEACRDDRGDSAPYLCEKVECAKEVGQCGAYVCNLPSDSLYTNNQEEFTCLTSCTVQYRGEECAEAFICQDGTCVPRCNDDSDCDTAQGLRCARGSCTPNGAMPCTTNSDCEILEFCHLSTDLCTADPSRTELISCFDDLDCPFSDVCDTRLGFCVDSSSF